MKNLISRVPLLVWFMIPTLILIGAGVWFFSNSKFGQPEEETGRPAEVSKPVEGTTDFDIVSREHIASGTNGAGYISNPPTSGPHWPAPAKSGIYDKELADEQIIHNMEHGHIVIGYKPDASDEVKSKLKEIVESDNWKVVLMPRSKNESMIALSAWGRVLNMNDLDTAKVEDFIKTYRNRGPEKTPE